MKRFQVIHDFPQYDGVLTPIEEELQNRGWDIVRTSVRDYNMDAEVNGSIGCQSGPWIVERPPITPSFLIFHGVSFTKICASKYNKWSYVILPSQFWADSLYTGPDLSVPLALGWSKADVLVNNKNRMDRFKNILVNRHKLDSRPIVLFAPTYAKRGGSQLLGSTRLLPDIVKALPDYNVIFMPHTMCDLKESFRNYKPSVSHDCVTKHEYILGADILISEISSLVFEFALLDKPLITLNDTSISGYLNLKIGGNELVDIGTIVNMNEINGLGKTVKRLLENPSENGERRKYWVEKSLGCCDGNSTVKIVDKIEEICGG